MLRFVYTCFLMPASVAEKAITPPILQFRLVVPKRNHHSSESGCCPEVPRLVVPSSCGRSAPWMCAFVAVRQAKIQPPAQATGLTFFLCNLYIEKVAANGRAAGGSRCRRTWRAGWAATWWLHTPGTPRSPGETNNHIQALQHYTQKNLTSIRI